MNYSYKDIWRINLPVMMSVLIEQLINITDAIFLGHLGEMELGASALAGIWYLAIYMLGFGFSQGLQVVIAQRNGERRYIETGKTFFQGLFFLSGLAVLLCLLSRVFTPFILRTLISSAEVHAAAVDYLSWRIWGLLFSFPFLALRAFLVGITRTGALNAAADGMSSVCRHAAELRLRLAGLCVYECGDGNGGDADGFRHPVDDHFRLSALSVGIEPLGCASCRLLDSGIPVRAGYRGSVGRLPEMQALLKRNTGAK